MKTDISAFRMRRSSLPKAVFESVFPTERISVVKALRVFSGPLLSVDPLGSGGVHGPRFGDHWNKGMTEFRLGWIS